MRRRLWVVLLLAYVSIDFLDPSVPGVFFLDPASLFVDSIVDSAKAGPTVKPAVHTMPYASAAALATEIPIFRPRREPARNVKKALRAQQKYQHPPARSSDSSEDH